MLDLKDKQGELKLFHLLSEQGTEEGQVATGNLLASKFDEVWGTLSFLRFPSPPRPVLLHPATVAHLFPGTDDLGHLCGCKRGRSQDEPQDHFILTSLVFHSAGYFSSILLLLFKKRTIIYWFILLLINTWLVSGLGLLQIPVLWTSLDISFGKFTHTFLLWIYQEEKWLSPRYTDTLLHRYCLQTNKFARAVIMK